MKVRTLQGGEAAEHGSQVGSLAPMNTRIIAALIDLAVAFAVYLAIFVMTFVVNMVMPHFLAWMLTSLLSVLRILALAYMVCRDSLPFLGGGQSVGKMVMKLKAVTLDGKSLVNNWEAALIRNISFVIPPLPLVELIILITREGKPEQGRRLGDEWAKTKVVIAEDAATVG